MRNPDRYEYTIRIVGEKVALTPQYIGTLISHRALFSPVRDFNYVVDLER